MNEKKKTPAWLVPAVIIAVVAVIGIIVYQKVHDLLFGGAVAVSIEDVYSNIYACRWQLVLIGAAIIAAIAVSIAVMKQPTPLSDTPWTAVGRPTSTIRRNPKPG